MTHYYNEIDPYPAQWLRNLMPTHIPSGYVDERDIRDIRPYELSPYKQCHFFAGIGGWPYALALAGFPANREVWTGSCPCQPFSQAGKQLGNSDLRHLWPAWLWLIRQCRPATIFGEQVASAIGHGWLDLVFSDLEGEGYACGAAVLPAASVGAPHPRNRLYFVGRYCGAHADRSYKLGRNCTMQVGRLAHTCTAEKTLAACRDQWSAEPKPPSLAHGISSRMEQCSAYGNAIVPQVAAEFIKAFLATEQQ